MVYCIMLHFLQFIFDIVTVSHLSEREKDVQILLLRQQLRIIERRQQHGPRLPRWQKLPLALLAGWLQRRGKVGHARLREVSLLFQPQTLLKWHREAVRRKWTFKRQGPEDVLEHNPTWKRSWFVWHARILTGDIAAWKMK